MFPLLHTYASIIYIELTRQLHKRGIAQGLRRWARVMLLFFHYDVHVVILLFCLIAFVSNRCIYDLLSYMMI